MENSELNRLVLILGLIEAKAPKKFEYLHEWIDPNSCASSHPDVELASALACYVLITDKGAVNWDNKRRLEAEGFKVFAGEKDSFGWLTGCIRTKVGVLVYG